MRLKITRRRIRGFIEDCENNVLSEDTVERIGRRVENEFGPIDVRIRPTTEGTRQFVLQIGEAAARKLRRTQKRISH